jgi:hypothetical protein
MKTNELKEYRITLRFQYPAWDEKQGVSLGVTSGKSKSDAIRIAKSQHRDVWDGARQGLIWWKAEEVK